MCCAKRSRASRWHSLRRYAIVGVFGVGVGSWMMLSPPVNAAEDDVEDDVETVLERIARTGKLVAGARANTLPFSDYTDNQWRGYSIELMQRIAADLEQQLRQPIELEIKEVGIDERTSQLREGTVDLICDATSFARSRDLEVDFSVGYFQTGTQLLFNTAIKTSERVRSAYADSAFIIGVVANTTNQAVIEQRLQIAQFVEFPSRAAGWVALQQGRVDALASDGILLEAMQQTSQSPENYTIAPPQPYDQEIYACVLPPDAPEFQTLVNDSLLKFMQGALNCNPDDLKLLSAWFGETAIPIDWQPLWELFQRQVNNAQANDSQANDSQADGVQVNDSQINNPQANSSAAPAISTPAQCFSAVSAPMETPASSLTGYPR